MVETALVGVPAALAAAHLVGLMMVLSRTSGLSRGTQRAARLTGLVDASSVAYLPNSKAASAVGLNCPRVPTISLAACDCQC